MHRWLTILLLIGSTVTAWGDDYRAHLDTQGRSMLDPIREEAFRPKELVARLALRPDARVADVGAGPGFWTVPLARAVPRGSVLALDIRADYLEVAAARAKDAGVTNVRTRVIPEDRPDLAPASVDVIFLAQVDHYLKDRTSYFAALAAALRPKGRIVLVNYQRYRAADLAAALKVSLRVVEQWDPSPPFFVLVLTRG